MLDLRIQLLEPLYYILARSGNGEFRGPVRPTRGLRRTSDSVIVGSPLVASPGSRLQRPPCVSGSVPEIIPHGSMLADFSIRFSILNDLHELLRTTSGPRIPSTQFTEQTVNPRLC